MAKENKTRYIILGLLSHEPMTGYDIRQTAERTIGQFWSDLSYGQIYPTLKAMEKEGLVSLSVEVEEGQRLKKVYSITPVGFENLESWLEEPADLEIFKLDILLRLYFGARVDTEHSIKRILAFKQRMEATLKQCDAFESSLKNVLPESKDHSFYLLTLQFGQHITKAQLKWADQALDMLKTMNS
ncbi:MAG: PadR family transcriptional regulator [Candidatus Thorarchaeota archaeon]